MDIRVKAEGSPSKELVRLIKSNISEFDRFEGSLISAAGGQLPKTVLITSCNPGEGKTSAAAGIGVSIAARGSHNILLIDANLRKPRLHNLFGQQETPGIVEIVKEGFPWQDAITVCSEFNLHVLSAGHRTDNPLPIFRSPRFTSTMQEMQSHYDCIIVDGPSFLSASECAYIAPMFEGILLVVACERTRWEPVSLVKSRIETVHGKVLGCIMNRRKYYIPDFLYRFF